MTTPPPRSVLAGGAKRAALMSRSHDSLKRRMGPSPARGLARRARPARRRHAEAARADVAELVDALDLGSSAVRRGGSSPLIRTRLAVILSLGRYDRSQSVSRETAISR